MGRRARNRYTWLWRLIGYIVSAAAAGAVAGAVLGGVGHELPVSTRAAIATLLASGAVVLGFLGLVERAPAPLQFDRETPQRWVHSGSVSWALKNGGSLGLGVGSRLGFWLWYAIPTTAFLSGDLLLGGLIYGVYGLVRAGGAVGLILASWGSDFNRTADWLISRARDARMVTDVELLSVGLGAAIGIGL